MGHLVDEQPLQSRRSAREIIQIEIAAGMEVQVPARRHDRVDGLEWEPSAATDTHRRAVHRIPEDRADEIDLARRQRPLTALIYGRPEDQWCIPSMEP
jgi:hypothetical protein